MNNFKLLLLTFLLFLSGCYECYSDACVRRTERERFLALSPEQQKAKREHCISLGIPCYIYVDPKPEELEKLKKEKQAPNE